MWDSFLCAEISGEKKKSVGENSTSNDVIEFNLVFRHSKIKLSPFQSFLFLFFRIVYELFNPR
jgi:hypothetical protein